MSTRRITAAIASNESVDLAGGKNARFSVTSDTGAIAVGVISAARLYISSFKSYATTYYLDVAYDSADNWLAITPNMASNSNTHSETVELNNINAALLASSPSSIYLKVVTTSGSGNKINFREGCTIALEIDYIDYTACGAPTACALSDTLATGNVVLSWSGATAGTNNAITGYEVQRCESSDGITWGSWATITTTAETALSVEPPTTAGNYYKYRVRTLGAAGASYYSGWAESTNAVRRNWTACGAPTACALSDTLATGNVVLSWSGATAGYGNAITGYEVQRCESSNGSTWGSWTAFTTTAETALSVAPPTTAGNYYKYRVRTLGAAGASFYSGWTESTNAVRRNWTACGAPTVCKLSETISDANVALSWSGATAGYGNAITGYEVQRCESSDGSTWGSWATIATTTEASLSVAPPTTAGNYYKYRVRTLGAAGASFYSAWKTSANTLRRDHAPLAGFSDETLTPGETFVKAIHIQELQEYVATLRAFYGLSAYAFTTIVAGQTSLAGWTAHVLEIREAVDGIDANHETWLTITENKPRADVIQQLRNVVLAL